jgi:hypothetical protein
MDIHGYNINIYHVVTCLLMCMIKVLINNLNLNLKDKVINSIDYAVWNKSSKTELRVCDNCGFHNGVEIHVTFT